MTRESGDSPQRQLSSSLNHSLNSMKHQHMGTQSKSPSLVLNSHQVLSEHLASHPELIGESVFRKFNAGHGSLPFLFKVLSIEKALSIQTHPDKKTAEILHAQYPDIYKSLSLYFFLLLISLKYSRPKSQTRNGSGHNLLKPCAVSDLYLKKINSQLPKRYTGPPFIFNNFLLVSVSKQPYRTC